MKKLFYLPALLALVITMMACSSKEKHKAGKKLEELHVSLMPGSAHIIVARNQGLFEKAFASQGIKVTYHECSYGPPMIEAFIANRIDVGLMGDQPALMAWAKDVDIKAVANFPAGYKNAGLVVVDTNKIKSIKDLKGKKIAVAVGSLLQHLLHLYLKEAGLTEKDVQILNFVNADVFVALSSKQIDAAVLSEPYLMLSENKKIAYKIKDATGYKFFSNPLLVSGSLLRNHPDVVQQLVKIYYDVNIWIKDHPEESAAIVRKEFNIPTEVIIKIIKDGSKDISFTPISVEAYSQTIDYLKETKYINPFFDKPITEFYDSQFINKIYKTTTTIKP